MTAARATRYGHLSGEVGFEFDGEKEKSFRENMAAESDSKLERGGDFKISAKTKTVKKRIGAARKKHTGLSKHLFAKQQFCE